MYYILYIIYYIIYIFYYIFERLRFKDMVNDEIQLILHDIKRFYCIDYILFIIY